MFLNASGSDEASDCISCSSGQYADPGSDQTSDCIECYFGTYSYLGSACTDCPRGQYLPQRGSDHLDDCIDCFAGKYVDFTGAVEFADCIDCVAGKYTDVTGSDEAGDCINCPAGTYASVIIAATRCTGCKPGLFSVVSGSYDVASCIMCGIGRYVETEGSNELSDCALCKEGRYGDEVGQVECKICGLGDYMPRQGGLACLRCCDGKSALENRTECLACSPGNISDGRTCRPCRENNFTRPGSAVCHACRPGFQSTPLHTQCVDVDECAIQDCVPPSNDPGSWLSLRRTPFSNPLLSRFIRTLTLTRIQGSACSWAVSTRRAGTPAWPGSKSSQGPSTTAAPPGSSSR